MTNLSLSPGLSAPSLPRRTRNIRYTGVFLGIVLAALSYFAMPQSAGFDARVTAAIVVLMGTWWITEALPLAVTAMVPLVAFPALGTADMKDAAASYSAQIIFLFLGGFLLALGIQRWNLHRRIALIIVLLVGTKPDRLILGMMLATAALGMWVSNTATALMMIPLGASLVTLIKERSGTTNVSNFSAGLLLGIAFAATISAFGTIIASPGNAFVVGYLNDAIGTTITFPQWMVFGTPLALGFTLLGWFIITKVVWKPEIEDIPGGRELFQKELAALGKMSFGECLVAIIFGITALAWMFVSLIFKDTWATDAVIAMIAGMSLFILPGRPQDGVMLMDWETARDVPWGTLLLFGGGLALSGQITSSGLDKWIGEAFSGLTALPFWVALALIVLIVILTTEITSSMATIATFVPIVVGLSQALGYDPLLMAIVVTQACQCAFMLPVASAPNAIAFGTGAVNIRQMVITGIWFNAIGFVLVYAVAFTLLPMALNL